jgi:hypothetical protein
LNLFWFVISEKNVNRICLLSKRSPTQKYATLNREVSRSYFITFLIFISHWTVLDVTCFCVGMFVSYFSFHISHSPSMHGSIQKLCWHGSSFGFRYRSRHTQHVNSCSNCSMFVTVTNKNKRNSHKEFTKVFHRTVRERKDEKLYVNDFSFALCSEET